MLGYLLVTAGMILAMSSRWSIQSALNALNSEGEHLLETGARRQKLLAQQYLTDEGQMHVRRARWLQWAGIGLLVVGAALLI